MKLLFSAGEPSGDYHASLLIRALREKEPAMEAAGLGGDLSTAAGLYPLSAAGNLSVMGITELIPRFRSILAARRDMKRAFGDEEVDAFVPVDYPGLNLRLARAAGGKGIPVVYYISPKFWAWNYRRIHEIGRLTEMVICILPFEEGLFREAGYRASFVGHPLVDEADRLPEAKETRAGLDLREDDCCLALLPGSRLLEVKRLLPLMLRGLKRGRLDRQFRVLIPVARPGLFSPVREIIGRHDFEATLIEGRAMETLRASQAAVVASGTASLEAALAGCPAVVVYRVSISTYITARLLIRTPYMSLPNLILKRPLLTELLQHEVTPDSIFQETRLLLEGDRKRVVLEGYQEMADKLGPPGAPDRAAEIILETVPGGEKRAERNR